MAFIAGGKSTEHDVSHLSAQVIRPRIDANYYDVTNLEITKEGSWKKEGKPLTLSHAIEILQQADLVFPMLHGTHCEDGMLQGFFQTLDVPYIGPDYRCGPVAMDKAWTKRIAMTHGIYVADFLEFSAAEWTNHPDKLVSAMTQKFSFPFYVKPAHLGSTFGVYRVIDADSLIKAVDAICMMDYKFLAEEEVLGREMEIGILGNDNLLVSDPAEVAKTEMIYTYEEKYGSGAKPALVKVALPPAVREEGGSGPPTSSIELWAAPVLPASISF